MIYYTNTISHFYAHINLQVANLHFSQTTGKRAPLFLRCHDFKETRMTFGLSESFRYPKVRVWSHCAHKDARCFFTALFTFSCKHASEAGRWDKCDIHQLSPLNQFREDDWCSGICLPLCEKSEIPYGCVWKWFFCHQKRRFWYGWWSTKGWNGVFHVFPSFSNTPIKSPASPHLAGALTSLPDPLAIHQAPWKKVAEVGAGAQPSGPQCQTQKKCQQQGTGHAIMLYHAVKRDA